jgi:hypothetical protein
MISLTSLSEGGESPWAGSATLSLSPSKAAGAGSQRAQAESCNAVDAAVCDRIQLAAGSGKIVITCTVEWASKA